MAEVYWANADRAGVIIHRDGGLTYLDTGPDYEAAVKAGPRPPRDFSDVVADDPKAVTLAGVAARVGIDQSQLVTLLRSLVADGEA